MEVHLWAAFLLLLSMFFRVWLFASAKLPLFGFRFQGSFESASVCLLKCQRWSDSETVALDLCCSPLPPVCGTLVARSEYSTGLLTGKELLFSHSDIDPTGQSPPGTSICVFICRLQDICRPVLTPPSYKYLHHWVLMWMRMTVLSSPVPVSHSSLICPVRLWCLCLCDWRLWSHQLWVFCFRACKLRGRNGCWASVSSLNTSLFGVTLPFFQQSKEMKQDKIYAWASRDYL